MPVLSLSPAPMTDTLEPLAESVSTETPTADEAWTTGDTIMLAAIAVVCLLVCWAVVRAIRRGAHLDYTDWRRHDHGYYPTGDSREKPAERRRRDEDDEKDPDGEADNGDAGTSDDGGDGGGSAD